MITTLIIIYVITDEYTQEETRSMYFLLEYMVVKGNRHLYNLFNVSDKINKMFPIMQVYFVIAVMLHNCSPNFHSFPCINATIAGIWMVNKEAKSDIQIFLINQTDILSNGIALYRPMEKSIKEFPHKQKVAPRINHIAVTVLMILSWLKLIITNNRLWISSTFKVSIFQIAYAKFFWFNDSFIN